MYSILFVKYYLLIAFIINYIKIAAAEIIPAAAYTANDCCYTICLRLFSSRIKSTAAVSESAAPSKNGA